MTAIDALKSILFDYDCSVCRDKRRFTSILSDYMPLETDKAYRNLIGISVDENIPAELEYDDQNSIYRCKQRLCNASGCTEEKASEIIDMWAEALREEDAFQEQLYDDSDPWNNSLLNDLSELELDTDIFLSLKKRHIDSIRELCTLSECDLISLVGEEDTSTIKTILKNNGYHLYKGEVDYLSKYAPHIRQLATNQLPGWEIRLFISILVYNMVLLESLEPNIDTYEVWFGEIEDEYVNTKNKSAINRMLEDYNARFDQLKEAFCYESIKLTLDTHNPRLIVNQAERIINPYKSSIALSTGFDFYVSYRSYIDFYYNCYIETGEDIKAFGFKEYNEWFSILADNDIGEFISLREKLANLKDEMDNGTDVDIERGLRILNKEFEVFHSHIKEIHQNAIDENTEWINSDNYMDVEKKKYGFRQCIRILNQEIQRQKAVVISKESDYKKYEIIWGFIKDLPLPSGKKPCDLEICERFSCVSEDLEYYKECSEKEKHLLKGLERELEEFREKHDELK